MTIKATSGQAPDGADTDTDTDTGDTGARGGSDDRDIAIRRRDAAIRRAQAAEEKASSLESRLAELEDQLGEYQSKGGELDKIVSRKETTIEKLTKDLEAAQNQLQSHVKGSRTTALVEALASTTKIPAIRLRGLLREAADTDDTFDMAPESVNDRTIKDYVRTLSKLDPDSFTSPEGKPRKRPGPAPAESLRGYRTGERPSDDLEAEWQERFAKTPGRRW